MGKIYEALERLEQESSQGPRLPAKSSDPHLLPGEPSQELVVLSKPGSVVAEQFRFLRSRLVRPEDGMSRRSILLSSALQGEGKTFIASNLAAILALGVDEHVLVIDADLRSPRMHEVFGYSADSPGLSDHLIDGKPLEEILQKTHLEKLTVLPAGRYVGNPTEVLSSKSMQNLLSEVRERYSDRFIIIDSPPLEIAPETVIMAQEVDGSYLIIRVRSTPRGVTRKSKERFMKEKFLGVIFNGYQVKENKYRYGYDHYHYKYSDKNN
jgi:capsular exopolysaccharide synthesis family protein